MSTVIDLPEPPTAEGKFVTLKWTITFDLGFDVPHPLSADEFIECARGHLEWMDGDIQEKFPHELLKKLDEAQLIRRETFKNGG